MSTRSRLTVWFVFVAVFTAGVAAGEGRVSPRLTAIYDEHLAHQAAMGTGPAAPFTSRDRWARVIDGDRVVVDVTAHGDARALESELIGLGMRHTAVFGAVVSGELPIAAVPVLPTLAGLRSARPSYAMRRAGSVTTAGDHAMNADATRAAYGVSGSGVKVGVLSDSFDCLKGASGGVSSGDLSTVTVVQEISDCTGATDEGRAMLEIVHDVAPGASLSFASAFNGIAAFANNIIALKNAGAQVIVDDIFYFSEPMFQDGPIAQAVDTVVSQGAAYFSAAGNEARQSYESAFRDGPTLSDGSIPSALGLGVPHFFGGVAHNFSTTGVDTMQRVTIPSGATLTLVLQWDEPFASVSGRAGAQNDLDIYVLNAAGTMVVGGSAHDNVGLDAIEMLDFTNRGPTADFNIMITRFAGTSPGFLKYVYFSPAVTIQEFATSSGTVWGHTNANGALAVGAAFWRNTPAFGLTPARLEPYSSGGPTPILFDASGQRLAGPLIRHKPEIVAPDGAATTFFGQTVPGFPSPLFFGTSAAAPHAAAVAALMLEKQPSLPPATVYSMLESTALDMGPPGFDVDSGFGLIQADAAVRAALGTTLTLGLSLSRHTASAGNPVQLTLTTTNTGPVSVVQDLYVLALVPPALSTAIGCPAGDAAAFATSSGVVVRCTRSTAPQSFPTFATSMVIPASPTPSVQPGFLSVTWPAGLPPGTYTFAVVATPPNAFADNVIGPGDITTSATDSLQSQ
jgi:hypothetical protein